MHRPSLFAAALLLTTVAGLGSAAAALKPLEAQIVSVGGRAGVLYYVDSAQGYEVVVTFAASSPDDGISMRSVATLAPGQQFVLSIGNDANARPATLTVRRDGDALVVLPPGLHTAAAR